MAKNNRVKITQSKTYSFKLDKIKYIERAARELDKSAAQILDDALQLHAAFNKEWMTKDAPTECGDVTQAS